MHIRVYNCDSSSSGMFWSDMAFFGALLRDILSSCVSRIIEQKKEAVNRQPQIN